MMARGCLVHVAIGVAEEVVGEKALVGSSMAVVVGYGFKQKGISGEGHIVQVLFLGILDNLLHPFPLAGATSEEKQATTVDEMMEKVKGVGGVHVGGL